MPVSPVNYEEPLVFGCRISHMNFMLPIIRMDMTKGWPEMTYMLTLSAVCGSSSINRFCKSNAVKYLVLTKNPIHESLAL